MMYEMYTRHEEDLRHATTLMTFEELVVLYLNYRPQVNLKFGEIQRAFDDLVLNDNLLADYGDGGILTRESFVHAMKTIGWTPHHKLLTVINYLMHTYRCVTYNIPTYFTHNYLHVIATDFRRKNRSTRATDYFSYANENCIQPVVRSQQKFRLGSYGFAICKCTYTYKKKKYLSELSEPNTYSIKVVNFGVLYI